MGNSLRNTMSAGRMPHSAAHASRGTKSLESLESELRALTSNRPQYLKPQQSMHWPAQPPQDGFEAEYPAVATEQMQALHASQAGSSFQSEVPSPSSHLSVVEPSAPKVASIYSPQVASIYSPQVGSIHSPPTFGARIYSPQVGSCSEGQIQKQLEQMEHARSREMDKWRWRETHAAMSEAQTMEALRELVGVNCPEPNIPIPMESVAAALQEHCGWIVRPPTNFVSRCYKRACLEKLWVAAHVMVTDAVNLGEIVE